MTLYNTYRPNCLANVCGQDLVKKSLENQIRNKDYVHAYLFTGPAGTGKTTMARILAAMVNAEGGPKVEISTDDAIVDAIIHGKKLLDVTEMDAASSRGIDDIKAIREKVALMPMELKKKVYIIDECHQLTNEAWNALLKILEEPPHHVIFILCTTDNRKVPDTIKTRCQCHEFRSITNKDIFSQLQKISSAEKISIEVDALRLVAQNAKGSLRNAISKLEKLSGLGIAINSDVVAQSLGVTGTELIVNFFNAVNNKDLASGMVASSQALGVGVSIDDFLIKLAEFCHDISFVGAKGYDQSYLGITEAEQQNLMEYKEKLSELVGKNQFRNLVFEWIKRIDEMSKMTVFRMQPQMTADFVFMRLVQSLVSFQQQPK